MHSVYFTYIIYTTSTFLIRNNTCDHLNAKIMQYFIIKHTRIDRTESDQCTANASWKYLHSIFISREIKPTHYTTHQKHHWFIHIRPQIAIAEKHNSSIPPSRNSSTIIFNISREIKAIKPACNNNVSDALRSTELANRSLGQDKGSRRIPAVRFNFGLRSAQWRF